ncbi:hypothetical protein M441DRAFT_361998 [Trichoderma asperellum CBS 433.97]|uniref:Uncharacterized protein n=1 Tax=Trichoderma asperellum (strain ATCC 204424 / CBS 433.97 / NBRC 101777) TaxID=1042311 RepID=A0A2T3ZDQ1_TRIA4|nr:hypothetical protein M441DRAFT_361998 [Trichoderma asperellum CBS 433.97]PTB42933.1 hypothetical protein M441DRAFT_361998 [Trichoderma asperellum CBS 433.97]
MLSPDLAFPNAFWALLYLQTAPAARTGMHQRHSRGLTSAEFSHCLLPQSDSSESTYCSLFLFRPRPSKGRG